MIDPDIFLSYFKPTNSETKRLRELLQLHSQKAAIVAGEQLKSPSRAKLALFAYHWNKMKIYNEELEAHYRKKKI